MYRSLRLPFALLTVIGLMFALSAPANAILLQDGPNDSDHDTYGNTIETKLGSDPADADSTPESMAVRPITPAYGIVTNQIPDTCRDGVDNDGDGQIDEGHDTGCDNPAVSTTAFPGSAGETAVAVRLVTKGLLVNAGPTIGLCASDFDGIGYAVIENDPADGTNPDNMDIEVTAIQVQGTSELIDDNPTLEDNNNPGLQQGGAPNPAGGPGQWPQPYPTEPTECGLPERNEDIATAHPRPPGGNPGFKSSVVVIQDPQAGFESFGSFTDANPGSALLDFPATSSIVTKTLTYPAGIGNTVKASGAPLVHNAVTQYLPYCTFNCDPISTDDPLGAGTDCYVGTDNKGTLCLIKPQDPVPAPAVDHFKLYKTTGPKITAGTVNVEDEFDTAGPESTQVTKFTTMGNPVDKNSEGILDNDNHLRCYKTKAPKFTKKTIISKDQFGFQKIEIKKPAELCMSAQKSPHAAPVGEDNFQCYTPSTKTKLGTTTVTLDDQFGPATTGVKVTLKPKLWCAPADVNGAGIPDPDAHLTCYAISGGTPKIAPVLGVTINPVATPDPPFATETVNAVKGMQLCTPTTRTS